MMTRSPGRKVGQSTSAHIDPEDFRVGGPVHGQAGGGAIQPDGRGRGALVSVRGAGVQTLPTQGAPAQPGQVGFRARFVEEDEPRRVEAGLPLPPPPTRPGDVRAVLFAGPECLFLNVRPIFWRV